MIFQTTPGIRKEWHDYGCYVHSILYETVRRNTNIVVTPERINDEFYPELVKSDLMTSNCYVNYPSEIFNYFGLQVAYEGKFGPERVCKPDEETEILLFHYEPRDWYHFVNGNGYGFTTFDPWGISTTATHGRLVGKRIFRLM